MLYGLSHTSSYTVFQKSRKLRFSQITGTMGEIPLNATEADTFLNQ
jgi:hypothetical protein